MSQGTRAKMQEAVCAIEARTQGRAGQGRQPGRQAESKRMQCNAKASKASNSCRIQTLLVFKTRDIHFFRGHTCFHFIVLEGAWIRTLHFFNVDTLYIGLNLVAYRGHNIKRYI
jgi:hypothetical protein